MSNSNKYQQSRKAYAIPETSLTRVEEMEVAYRSPFQKASMARKGINTEFVADLMRSLNINKQETARLIDISAKTLDRHLQNEKVFKGLQSDRILELADLYNQGINVFASRSKFLKWLDSEVPALGGTCPRQWLDTQQGITAISDELGKIKHGLFA